MPEPRSHKLDVIALALLALVLFLAVALVTYHPNDLSIDSGASQPPVVASYPSAHITPLNAVVHKIANACGRSGAYVAEGLFRLLGWGAYFFVGSLLLADIWLLARRPINDLALRASGWIMALVGVSTMLALIGPAISPGPLIGPGGYLGAAGRAVLEINFAITGRVHPDRQPVDWRAVALHRLPRHPHDGGGAPFPHEAAAHRGRPNVGPCAGAAKTKTNRLGR